MITFKAKWGAKAISAFNYSDDEKPNKQQLAEWKKGSIKNEIIIVATGRKNGERYKENTAIIYRPYDYLIPLEKRKSVPQIVIICDPKNVRGKAVDVTLITSKSIPCPIRENTAELFEALMLVDQHYFRAGQIMYFDEALFQNQQLRTKLLEQLQKISN